MESPKDSIKEEVRSLDPVQKEQKIAGVNANKASMLLYIYFAIIKRGRNVSEKRVRYFVDPNCISVVNPSSQQIVLSELIVGKFIGIN